MHLSQLLFQLHRAIHYNIQPITLIDMFIFIEDDWIQHKLKHQCNILDIIDLHEKEKRIYHHASVIEKHNIETMTLF